MSEQVKKRGSLLEFFAIFAIVYLLTQFAFRTFLPQKNAQNGAQEIILKSTSSKVKGDHDVILSLENKTQGSLTLKDRCPMPPVEVYRVSGSGAEKMTPLTTTETALPCTPVAAVPAGKQVTINLAAWKYSLFSDLGTYEVRLPKDATITGTGGVIAAPSAKAQFTLVVPGALTKLFRAFITKPFLNALIFIASVLPNHSLGIGIIILTVIVKLLLFIPTQHALEGQKKMQKAQPLLDDIRRRFKEDPKRMQEETMKVWKEHKINPFQSCLPTLVQLPVLIGLFYVIRDGSVLATSQHLIYGPYLHLAWTFNTQFIGFDLLKPSVFIFPPLLVLMQFLQMKLTFAINERKKKAQQGDKPKEASAENSQKMQQNMMLYGLPLMIGFFAIKFPAAVSLYWGISTLFAIGQQIIVNREKITL